MVVQFLFLRLEIKMNPTIRFGLATRKRSKKIIATRRKRR